ncbi:MAG: methylated-DNA--[protein]-cysteine S-methyltransferase [Proteobacteria bacterium]|nr:methylated-DNA--[protein]-cysteine S-methyltransferase [Desulfobacula sp.]MBU3953906.1 methylated-DNA--[protein]-cysteine S-methyltransferase [Pseudomonadota bacterium]MBU4130947.1 methylated-DNA--[protein]-cysteine S-methyltransferase [Pseudomonadota bacterium]
MYYCTYESPVGLLRLTGGDRLETLTFLLSKTRKEPESDWTQDTRPFAKVLTQLDAYFGGSLKRFNLILDRDLKIQGTDFQQKVWKELLKIPYGQTISYGQLAERIGNPTAFRAVGLANGKNPISIIIPCHRVIGKDGSLTGFGGGIDVKRQLLSLEQANG